MKFALIAFCLLPACAWATTPTVMVGAHANPDNLCTGVTAVTACEADFAALQTAIGYNLGIDSQYARFDEFSSTTGLMIAADDITAGRTPMLTWYPHYANGTCPTYNDIAAGVYDTQLADQASGLAALGGAILIRFAPAMDTGIHDCAYSSGAQGDPVLEGAEFVPAWQHLVTVIHATASNALFIWSPNAHSFSDNSGNPLTTWEDFYPGDAYVDWIGSQIYNQGTTKLAITDDVVFNTWYGQVSTMDKPLIFSETGAIGPDPQTPCTNSTSSSPSPQDKWLYTIRANFSATYPAMKALAWFDVAASNGTHCNNYIIRGDGLTQFQALMSHVYFQKMTP
jgi:hypothetical protein